MIDKATIVAQIEKIVQDEATALETKIDTKLHEMVLPCHVHIGKVSSAALDAVILKYKTQGKWTVEVYEEKNDTITLTFR